MNDSSDSIEAIELLADDFMAAQRRGETPSIEQYCAQHPELAAEIREVFPALMVMEEVAPASADLSVSKDSVAVSEQAPISQIADYRILREIGRGGMGVVYEAEQQSLGRRVALKVLPRQVSSDENSLKRFQQEARAAARMHHTNIVPVFEVGEDNETVFYAMQLIHGQGLDLVINDLRQLRSERVGQLAPSTPAPSLAASLVAGKFEQENLLAEAERAADADDVPDDPATRVTETIATNLTAGSTAKLPGQSEISTAENDRRSYFLSIAEIGVQAARGLSYAHARGIIHRDIKPSNLLLDTGGVVWITDFGLAKTGNSAMTQTGDILGTIRYMSPERFKGFCDVRADIYALGLTLYELAVLKPAFESPDRLKLMNMVVKEEATAPRSIDSRIPRDLETIILKAADKDPRRRYQSADELADDLQRFVHDEPIQARRISLAERVSRWSRRNKAVAASMAMVATLVLCVAIGAMIVANKLHWNNRRLVIEQQRASDAAAIAATAAKQADLAANRNAQLAQEKAFEAQNALRLKSEAESARAAMAEQQAMMRRSLYAAEINMAQYAAKAGDGQRSQELLDSWRNQEEDLRGWEWYQLIDEITVPFQEVAFGQTNNLGRLDWSPDGAQLAVSSFSGEVAILDGQSLERLESIKTELGWVAVSQWSPDGRQLAVVGGLGLEIWDFERKQGCPASRSAPSRSLRLLGATMAGGLRLVDPEEPT